MKAPPPAVACVIAAASLLAVPSCAVLEACGDSKSRYSSGMAGSSRAFAAIEWLEQQGVLPNLDRGTDIAGPDVNRNGVRDDIDAYIATLPVTDPQRKAIFQRAREQQAKLLLDPTDRQAVIASSERSMAAASCMWDRFNSSDDLSARIEAITANTPERAKRYMRYMAALGGTSVWAPDGDTCEP